VNRFAYVRPTTLDGALQAVGEGWRALAGGTDLLGLMKRGLAAPDRLVSLREVEGLRGLERREEGWFIGAMTPLSELSEGCPDASERHLAALSEAAGASASPQLRNAATLGGNLLQRPRCWYYRNPQIRCWLKGGERCYAASGRNAYHSIMEGGPCYAVHPSDPAVALLALDAEVEITGRGGAHHVAVEAFFSGPRQTARSETSLREDELITGVFVPEGGQRFRAAYAKVSERAAFDFALVSAAAGILFDGEDVSRARIALGGVAPVPIRARRAEELLEGGRLSVEAAEAAAEAATAAAEPLADNGYKVQLTKAVLREVLSGAKR
jgi:xanthine dehydrogenase YagS FAD-binding subunit